MAVPERINRRPLHAFEPFVAVDIPILGLVQMAQSVVILCNRSSIIIQVTVFILQHVDSVFFYRGKTYICGWCGWYSV